MSVDTTLIPDGTHQARIFATDVAGNRGISSQFDLTTRNESRPNGADASRSARLDVWVGSRTRRSATLNYGAKRTIAQSKTGDGVPIPGAVVEVRSKHSRTGATERGVGQVTTDANGRFTMSRRPDQAARSASGIGRSRSTAPTSPPSACGSMSARGYAGRHAADDPERESSDLPGAAGRWAWQIQRSGRRLRPQRPWGPDSDSRRGCANGSIGPLPASLPVSHSHAPDHVQVHGADRAAGGISYAGEQLPPGPVTVRG